VDGVRARRVDALGDPSPARQGEPQARIGRNRKRRKSFRRKEIDRGAEIAGGALERAERAHDAVNLRMPGVRRHEYFHLFGPGREIPVVTFANRVRQELPFHVSIV
jgi:hypothetical protein